MGLDIISNNNAISLSHSEFNTLLPYFKMLYEKTGIEINEYKDFKLSPSHANILYKLISDNIGYLGKNKKYKQLESMLKDALAQSEWLILQGD